MIIVHRIKDKYYLVDMTHNHAAKMVEVSKAVAVMALSRR